MADQRETVVYNGDKYHRYPNSEHRQLRVYFWAHTEWKESPVALHRQKWIDKHGDVPEGHDIHHEDDNPLNNDIDNLVAISRGDHAREHSNWGGWESDEIHEEALESAAEWHKSEEGSEWHNEHYENTKEALHKKRYTHECEWCGDEYDTNREEKTRFCSDYCQQKQWEVDNQEIRECEECSGEYEIYKFSKRKYCPDCSSY